MSYTSLWAIDKNWSGKEYSTYHNSWLFAPTVWDVLLHKYVFLYERGIATSYLTWVGFLCNQEEGNKRAAMLNDRINESSVLYDRVLWELANLSVFNAKDKELVADCIEKFVENSLSQDPEYANRPCIGNVKERFFEVAKDVRELPKRVKYFVIRPTNCDDNVVRWFNHKRLCSWDLFVCEFTLIENGGIVGFASNLEMCKKNKED